MEKKDKKEKNVKKNNKGKKNEPEKKSLWTRFRIFCHGVKSETEKIHWPNKKDMIKYSIATIIFIIFFGVFFYSIDTIFTFLKSLVK